MSSPPLAHSPKTPVINSEKPTGVPIASNAIIPNIKISGNIKLRPVFQKWEATQ